MNIRKKQLFYLLWLSHCWAWELESPSIWRQNVNMCGKKQPVLCPKHVRFAEGMKETLESTNGKRQPAQFQKHAAYAMRPRAN